MVQVPLCQVFRPHLGTLRPPIVSLKIFLENFPTKICNNFSDTEAGVMRFLWYPYNSIMSLYIKNENILSLYEKLTKNSKFP